MNIKKKVKNALINIKIKAELKQKIQVYAAERGVTVTDLLTDFIESVTLKKQSAE